MRVSQRPAKSVLLLWLWGGPAQLDTWDPKPNAPQEFRGPFAAIQTKTPGLRFGELGRVETRVGAPGRDEGVVGALLDDRAVLHHQDHVRVADR